MTETSNVLSLKDFLTLVFTSVGLLIAFSGLKTWKKQIKGSKEFDVAYNLHLAALKIREAMKHVRNPAIWPSESLRAIEFLKTKYPEKSEEEIKRDERAGVYEMRWQKINTASTEAEAHLLAAEALWGSEIVELIQSLNKQVKKLNFNLNQMFAPELRTINHNMVAVHDVVYDKSSETELDSFTKETNEIIKAISDYLKKKIA